MITWSANCFLYRNKTLFVVLNFLIILSSIWYWRMSNSSINTMASEVESLYENFWNWRLKQSPEFATFIGNHEHDDKLQSYVLSSFEKRKLECESYLVTAKQLLTNPSIIGEMKLNLELFVDYLETFSKGMDSKGYLFPINTLEGVHIEFERLIMAMDYNTEEDYQKLLSRFNALTKQIAEIIAVMEEGIKLNMTNHRLSMEGVLEQMEELQKEPRDTPFYKPFLSMPDAISEEAKKRLRSEAIISIESILSSFKQLKEFIEFKYWKHLRPDIGVSSLPNGKAFYEACLLFHLGFPISPEEVHAIGLKEVGRISKEIKKVIESMGLNLTLGDFLKKMKGEQDQYFETADALMQTYHKVVFDTISPKLHTIVKEMPKSKLKIEMTPASMSGGPAAYYLAGTPDGKKKGTFYVNAANIKEVPKFEIMTLALHEGIPGHHLQLSFAMEQENQPEFRRHIEDRIYSDAPSRFPLYTAYAEGWGLYSEYLGYELGMYKDVYYHFGSLSYEIFRACRLVVDTGMHALGWTFEQAVDYMLAHVASSKSSIEKEVRRYITWPGQACAYKIGEIKIKSLRKSAEEALGSRFDIKEFHDIVLRNAGPLSLLERKVTDFIVQQKL